MNWTHMTLIPIGIIILIWTLRFTRYKKDHYFGGIAAFWTAIIGVVGFITIAAISQYQTHLGWKTMETGELVSLENSHSRSANLNGSFFLLGGSINGSYSEFKKCSFVLLRSNGEMSFIEEKAQNITFLTHDGPSGGKVEIQRDVYYHPFSRQGNSVLYWYPSEVLYRISIPKNSINSYIRFN